MSTEKRLDRLGLRHLADKPEELRKEVARRLREQREAEQAWEKERAKKKTPAARGRPRRRKTS